MQTWELSAREHIRDTLARYTWSGDAGRVAGLADAFCPDGVLEIRGEPPLHGRAAIIERLGAVAETAPAVAGGRRIVRHNVANIRFDEVSPDRARVSSYFTVFTEIGLDHFGRYRDELVPVAGADGTDWLIRHRFVSTDWSAPNSTMAG
ncbi:nuclear transport factor 2 family protein [[Mycobacterium] burgundiense]|uniref:Nuclear transport factor 2 family protein n=1 Tax=[Mycobacterium] burgundiense TaxID=3064286 RepID=A0ABM9LSK9_9MYCO|nr:nuclear transport factor 2 family protein [Mycolicibacterium sp. MU0053]CAJ1503999.1 nuclear transport factor 2 family protein [Mycolicibacterium sp. MU0053]